MVLGQSNRPDTQRVLGQEEAQAQALLELMEIQDQKTKSLSDLTLQEIGTLALLQTLYQRTKINEIGDFVELYCQFKVSRDRLGRREITNAITLGGLGVDDRRKKNSIKDLFSGIRS